MGSYSGTPIYRTTVESNGNTTKNYVNPPRDIHDDGTDIDENDFYGMTSEEIYDLIIENPTGTAKWVNDIVYNMEVKEGK